MKDTITDGYHDMNAAYFLGCMSVDTPTQITEAPAVAGDPRAGAEAAAVRTIRSIAHSFRKRPRKQKMMTVAELHTANRALEARKEAAEIKRNLAAVQMEAAEGAKRARQNRQQTLALKQGIRAQLQQQQIQALEATRASQKATAAAARRAALHNDTLAVQQEGKAGLTSVVTVPKPAIHTGHEAGASSEGEGEGEGSSGRQANQQKGPTAPSTPPKKAVKSIPSSSSTIAAAADAKFCQCCFVTSTPIWRRGGLHPYEGLTVCNACGMWEMHNRTSLVHSGKVSKSCSRNLDKCVYEQADNRSTDGTHEDKHRSTFLANGHQIAPAAGEMPNTPVRAQAFNKGQVVPPLQAKSTGHGYGTRSSLSVAASAAAAAGGGEVMQQADSGIVGRQPVQPVQVGRCVDEGSGTEAVDAPKAARKRKAANSILQPSANKRSKVASQCSHGAAIAMEGSSDVHESLDKGGPGAADGFGGNHSDMALHGTPGAAQPRRALRLKKGKGSC